MKRLLREPLIRFLVIGAVIFSVFRYMQPERRAAWSSRQIQLSLDELTQMAQQFRAQWRREPTAQDFDHLVESKVQQKILYREALAMGLDKDDVVRLSRRNRLEASCESAPDGKRRDALNTVAISTKPGRSRYTTP